MTLSGDDFDEPTVVGRRPIGPRRAAPTRSGGAFESAPRTPVIPELAQPARLAATAATGPIVLTDASSDPEDLFVSAAAPLLVVIAHLRDAVSQADVSELRKEMVDQLKRFDERALRAGGRAGDVNAARYVLCSLIDETVMTTPWGAGSAWSANSLLHELHSETWGGEKVFAMLDMARREPVKNIAILKLIEICLLLGFEGKYRVLDSGREQLAELRRETARLLRQYVKSPPSELSPSWRGVAQSRALRRYLPLWVVFAVAAAIVISSYGVAKWRIVTETAPADQALQDIVKS